MSRPKQENLIRYSDYDENPVAHLYLVDSRISGQPQEIFPIWDRKVFRIGRDPYTNTFAIQTDQENLVSRNHCEFYVVVYEHSANHIYVRDQKSSNGTYVNGNLIGIGPQISSGYLLNDGDVIEIRPYWRFILCQIWKPPERPLTLLQKEECKAFADRYLVTERCIGHGAEATIYLAVEAKTKRQLVCKMVNLGQSHRGRVYEENRHKLQEAEVLRQLQHPNILPFIDAISSPRTLYTFTELAAGGDLLSFVLRHDFVHEFDARLILRQVVRGLQYLHSKGFVHRDLKLENVLLAYSPKIAYHRILLSDFGTCAAPCRNRMRTQVGTQIYQAPEIRKETESQTSAVDIWSLGIVALLLLTSGNESVESFYLKNQRDIDESVRKVLCKVSPKVSVESEDFVSRCLRTVPSERMTAAEAGHHDMFQKLEEHVERFQKLDQRAMKSWSPQKNARQNSLLFKGTAEIFDEVSMDIEENEIKNPLPPVRSSQTVGVALFEGKEQSHQVKGSTRENLKTRQISREKLRDNLHLTLPGLGRHLRQPSSGNQRRQILAKLEETGTKFLADAQSALAKYDVYQYEF